MLNILGFKFEEEEENNLKQRESLKKLIYQLPSRYDLLIESFYDKKRLIVKSQSEGDFFKLDLFEKEIKRYDQRTNWYDNIYYKRRENTIFKDKYNILIGGEDELSSIIGISYTMYCIKFILLNKNYGEKLTKKDKRQFYKILIGNIFNINMDIFDDNNISKIENYIIIQYKSIYYKFFLVSNFLEIYKSLKEILKLKSNLNNENYIGYLSQISDWYNGKELFSNFITINENNDQFIKSLQNSLCIINIMDCNIEDNNIKQMCFNNIYCDKIFNTKIFKNGDLVIDVENFIDYECINEIALLYKEVTKFFYIQIFNIKPTGMEFDNKFLLLMNSVMKNLKMKENKNNSFEIIKYHIDNKLLSYYNLHIESYKILYSKTSFYSFEYKININKLSSKLIDHESFFTLSVLSALYKYMGELEPAIQKVSTRGFKNGGSEYLRLNSKKVHSFILSMNLDNIPRELKIKLGYDAMKEYCTEKQRVKDGYSIISLLKIYEYFDIIYQTENKTIYGNIVYQSESHQNKKLLYDYIEKNLLTLNIFQINNNIKMVTTFPENDEGIGISIFIDKQKVKFLISTYFFNYTFLKKLGECIQETLFEMGDLFIQKVKYTKF